MVGRIITITLLGLLIYPNLSAAQESCTCSGWEDHPNTLLGDDGSGITKMGISFDDCRAGCCDSDECVAFGHCIEGAGGAACAWAGSGRCFWYKTNTRQLRHNNGHFTGFVHGAHCKPPPGGGDGQGGAGGGLVIPHWATGLSVGSICLICGLGLCVVYLSAFHLDKLRQPRDSSNGWRGRHRLFWASTAGLVRDGVAFSVASFGAGHVRGGRPFLRGGGIRASIGAHHRSSSAEAVGGDSNLLAGGADSKAPLLCADGTATVASDAAGQTTNRRAPTRLHVAAQLGDATRLRHVLDQHTADVGLMLNTGDHRQYTPLHVACAGGFAECARLLVVAGALPSCMHAYIIFEDISLLCIFSVRVWE
jgi:hypothetical protein